MQNLFFNKEIDSAFFFTSVRRNMFFERRLLRLARNDTVLQVLSWVGRG